MSRSPLDRYDTPEHAIAELMRLRPDVRGRSLLSPTCGDGRIGRMLKPRFAEVEQNDIDPTTTADHHLDAREEKLYRKLRPDWTIDNPPFNCAAEILRHALAHTQCGIAFLLRLSFAEPTIGRQDLPPPTEMHVLPRYKFDGKGTDSVTCAWFVWLRGPDGWIRRGITISPRPAKARMDEEHRAGMLAAAVDGRL